MTKLVPLTRGFSATVDDEDYENVVQFRWTAYSTHNLIYATRLHPRRSLHRFLLGVDDPKIIIDHANGDGLDNRRSNLRICEHKENMRNRRKVMVASSRFKGVRVNAVGNWRAEIQQNGQRLHLGTFKEEERAARLYDKAAKVFFGKYALTNEMLGLL